MALLRHGLFSSGRVIRWSDQKKFHWVFDCGSLSKRQHLEREIEWYEALLSSDPINLFCLSHFDADHLNGARRILESHRIETLVLPYVPLVERMLLATQTPNISLAFLSFLADPVAYLFNVQGGNLGQIIFISGWPASEGPLDQQPRYDSDDQWTFKNPPPDNSNESPNEEVYPSGGGIGQEFLVVSHSCGRWRVVTLLPMHRVRVQGVD